MNFRDTMIACGLNPRDIVADGRWYRCPTADHPHRKNGCYLLRPCGSRGYFKNYALEEGWNEWRDDRPMTLAQLKRANADLVATRRREARRRMRAVREMRAHWSALPPLREGHPYLEAKGLSMMGCAGLRVNGERLVIPALRNGTLRSLQTITPTGEKRYRYGCSMKGAAYELTRPGAVLTCLVEGFATGLAIFQSMPQTSVIVCFDATNMVWVAQAVQLHGMLVVCADNDWATAERTGTNMGIQKGTLAAQALGCGLAFPQGIEGSDWADALHEWGDRGPARLRMEIMRHARLVGTRHERTA
jgi:putative DNA primase/helicase